MMTTMIGGYHEESFPKSPEDFCGVAGTKSFAVAETHFSKKIAGAIVPDGLIMIILRVRTISMTMLIVTMKAESGHHEHGRFESDGDNGGHYVVCKTREWKNARAYEFCLFLTPWKNHDQDHEHGHHHHHDHRHHHHRHPDHHHDHNHDHSHDLIRTMITIMTIMTIFNSVSGCVVGVGGVLRSMLTCIRD